eukprot:GILI01012726.1.p1 GENE.GILI01012726.1~~GILI01012726.1.p1  ORF type:complete len:742 (+),score=117.98 GILI01012726.1:36-2228(+)
MRILRSVSPSPVKGISSKSAERLRSHSTLGGGNSSEEQSPSSRPRSKIQNDNLEEDLLLTSAYKLQCERATLKFKVVQKERARLVEILMSGANERIAREEKENEMMRRPKRMRKIVPGILLNHEENTLHAQLTAQETDDQKLRRASMLELRKAMLVGDATVDESMGDNIPGMLDAGIDPVILKHLEELRLEAEQATAEQNSLDVENEPNSATQYSTPYPLSPRAIQSRRRKLHISRDLAEREAVRTLLSVQSSSQESEAKFETDMALIARRGQEKIEKIRKRHMNTLVDEISRIQERDELLAHLEEREVVWREMNAERKRELHEKVVAADLLRNEKIAQHEAEAERVTSERKAKLQNNIDRRDERLALIEAENESERNKRMAELELSMQEARERLAAREVELKTKADLQRDETAAKMSLHGARKNNLLTRRDVLFATLSSESQKKQVEAHRRREGRGNAYAESLETTITAREAEARARRTIHKQNRKDFLRKQVEDNDLRTMAAGVNRDEDEQFKQQWRDAIDEDWEDKKALVDMQAADRDRDCKLKQALTTLKEEAHSENMQRLERVTEYTYSVKKSVVEAQAAHTEMKKKVAEHHREELRQNRMFMAHKQEIVQSSIVTMMNGNKFPTKRDELEAVIESMSPENKKKQHQLENARRELQQAKRARGRQQIDGSAPHNTHQLPPSRGTRASSPITQPTSLTFLDSYMNEGSNSFSSPVDEIIKRIRRSR